MVLKLADWVFAVDVEATRERTKKNSLDHCLCGYCRNYYEAVGAFFPSLVAYLEQFGVDYLGPSELMPFMANLILACYRVSGQILTWGKAPLEVCGIAISPEAEDDQTFLLWVGEVSLPWLQEENPEDVVSPANLPEFFERMNSVLLMRHGEGSFYS